MKERATTIRCSSPIHIHVDDVTPVHVHVKKIRKSDGCGVKPDVSGPPPGSVAKKAADPTEISTPGNCSQQHKGSAAVRHKSRSKSPCIGIRCPSPLGLAAGPWIPPPARTSRGLKYGWQGPSPRMEIQPARDNQHSDANAARRHDEPDTDEEDRQSCRVRQYEKRIETLMEQVAVLKEDVERANKAPDVGSPAGQLPLHDRLMKQLAEVDACVESVSKHLCTVSSALQQRQKDEKRVGDTVATATVLANHRQLLLDKMAALDTSCRRLKQTLSEQREQTSSQQCLIEQRDQLISQITRLELAAKASKKELKEKTVQIAELRALCDLQTDEALGATELQGSLETSKSQLMKQLRQRDLDCSKMALELQNVHNQLSHERGEVENLRLLVREAQLKAKLLRKKSSRQLGSSGCPDEDDAGRPTNMDRDSVVGSLQTELDSLRDYCNKLVQERTQHSDEAAAFQTRVRELETVIERMAEDGKKELAVITSRLHDKSAEAADYCRENERLRSSLSSMECKLDHVTCDATVLRAKVAEYERMIEDYRCQLTRSRREADDTLSRLEDTRRDMNRLRQENENELDRVKQQMQARLKELEPTSELLRAAEQRLEFVTEQLEQLKQFHENDVRLVSELTAKVEQQSVFECEKRDLLRRVAEREDAVHQANRQVQEVMSDNSALKHRMEALLADNQRKSDLERDKLSARERAQRAHILDLETQVNQLRTEVLKLRHDNEEGKSRFNSQIYDLRDRLEQSHSTNRSLQSYVEFLKNSYTSCFTDAVSSSPTTATSAAGRHVSASGTVPRTTFPL